MKATYRVRQDLAIELEAATQEELFRELASAFEVLGEKTCGLCGGAEIVPAHRTVTKGKKQYEYSEWRCTNSQCGGRLNLGAMLEGGRLFPHRKLDRQGKPDREQGTAGAHRGWTKYRGQDAHDDAPAPQQGTPNPGAGSPPAACITPQQWEQIKAQLVRHGLDARRVLGEYGIRRGGELPAAKFVDCLSKATAGYAAWKTQPATPAKRR